MTFHPKTILLCLLLLAGSLAWGQQRNYKAEAPMRSLNAAELQMALDRTQVLGSVLYVAAHPDDENTRLITYLATGKGLRTTYLALTRGDGGQNTLGPEKGPSLGVLRTQELLAARNIDGGNQRFTRAIDFGYSKNPEETLEIWDREKVLGDVVRTFRELQPDVIITRFPTPKNGARGHGHHTASAILAGEAFGLAGDPSSYPGTAQKRPKALVTYSAFSGTITSPTGDPRIMTFPIFLLLTLGNTILCWA